MTMKIKKKVLSVLQEAWIDGGLIEVKRERFGASEKGFVIDISGEWLLMHVLDGDFLQFNGYGAVRLRDITKVEKNTDWVTRARGRLGLEPVLLPDVLLVDLPGLLSSVNAHFPVLGIERDAAVPQTLHVGRIQKLREKSVTLRELGAQAEWVVSEIRYPLREITCVSFGTTYMGLLLEFARIQEAEAALESDESENQDIS
ncbi:MAG: hypothetical protein H7Z41_07085 [Cytophagales bacterium]|nr:hypothetical protein [Armatimonadota bacterium]